MPSGARVDATCTAQGPSRSKRARGHGRDGQHGVSPRRSCEIPGNLRRTVLRRVKLAAISCCVNEVARPKNDQRALSEGASGTNVDGRSCEPPLHLGQRDVRMPAPRRCDDVRASRSHLRAGLVALSVPNCRKISGHAMWVAKLDSRSGRASLRVPRLASHPARGACAAHVANAERVVADPWPPQRPWPAGEAIAVESGRLKSASSAGSRQVSTTNGCSRRPAHRRPSRQHGALGWAARSTG